MGTEIFIPEGATFNPAVMGYDSLGRKRCNFKIYDSLDNEVPFDFDPDTKKIRVRMQNKTIGTHNLKIKFFNDIVDSGVLKSKFGENYTISLAYASSSAITETGKLYTWGFNNYGQIGDGTTTNISTPTLIDSFGGEKIVAVSLGYYHSSAITETGKLYTWGYNYYGQLGDGTTTQRNTPTLIDAFGGEKIVAVSLGQHHSSAITETGKLYTWGFNNYGQIGDGTTTNISTPTLIDSFGGEKIVSVSLGTYHTSAITETGKLYTWGYNYYGQLGDGTTTQRNTPTLIDAFGGEKIVAVSLWGNHSSAITETGKLYTWGYNTQGQLGDGTTTQRNTPTLIDAFGGEKIVAVSLGQHHSSAITETGKLYTWGFNNYGQIGDGTTTNRPTPTLIDAFGGEKIVAVSLGGFWNSSSDNTYHSSAITETGKLYTWGRNHVGQLGDGTTTNISTPTLIDATSFSGENIELPVNNMTTLKTAQTLTKNDLTPIYK
jgi:alpha-tubulin suppressor-like RCC1 family protein